MIGIQPLNQFGWTKTNNVASDTLMGVDNETCPNKIGIERYIPYIVVKTDSFQEPSLELWLKDDEEGVQATSDELKWVSIQNNEGVTWVLTGGYLIGEDNWFNLNNGGLFRFVIRTVDEFGKPVFYYSQWFQYDLSGCLSEIRMSSCSDVSPYLFSSGYKNKNFGVDADVRVWVDSGDISFSYETINDDVKKKKSSNKVVFSKVIKYNHIRTKVSNSTSDLLMALSVFTESILIINNVFYSLGQAIVDVNIEPTEYCGITEIKWVASSIWGAGCCGIEAERLGIRFALEYEGELVSMTDHHYTDSNGDVQELQIGQYAILDGAPAAYKLLVIKKPNGSLEIVENLTSGDAVHFSGAQIDDSTIYVFNNGNPSFVRNTFTFSQTQQANNDIIVKCDTYTPAKIGIKIGQQDEKIISGIELRNGLNIGNQQSGTQVLFRWLDANTGGEFFQKQYTTA